MKRICIFLPVLIVLVTGCGCHRFPDCADDIGCIAFVSNRYQGTPHIFVMRPDRSDTVRLAPGREPVWSPDGKLIAFTWDPDWSLETRGDDHIYVMNADGSGVTRLTDRTFEERSPAWSHDGRHIAFVSERVVEQRGIDELCVTTLDGVKTECLIDTRSLVDSNDFLGDLSWSPDDSRIVFSALTEDGDTELFVVNTCLAAAPKCEPNPLPLTNNTGDDHQPVWSPDGNRVVFSYDSGIGGADIYIMGINGDNPVQLTSGETDDIEPTWSPDGNRIIFAAVPLSGTSQVGAHQLFLMNADGSDITRLTEPATVQVRTHDMLGITSIVVGNSEPNWWGIPTSFSK